MHDEESTGWRETLYSVFVWFDFAMKSKLRLNKGTNSRLIGLKQRNFSLIINMRSF